MQLIIAPDGELNLVHFAALVGPDGHYLGEEHSISYLSCGRDLLRYEQSEATAADTVILADPDYDMSGKERATAARRLAGSNKPLALRGVDRPNDLASATWGRLPGARLEGEAIKQILRDENPRLFLGKDALEEVAKRLHSPRRIHFATHGFFLKSSEKPLKGDSANLALPQNPLLRSGLILSGANRSGRAPVPAGADDGILTALEVSALPFWNTDLIVLSACETGLGETRLGEGVFGLRRAFQLAGARSIIMSLWKVPDKETRDSLLLSA